MAKTSRPPDLATLSRFDEARGRARRVDASPSRGLLPVRRVADLERDGLEGLIECYRRQEVLHAERVVLVVLEEQAHLVEVVLGAVGSARPGYACIEKPFGVLCGERIHGHRV